MIASSDLPQVCVSLTSATPTTKAPTTTKPAGPSPTQSGIAANCKKYYQAVSGDYCKSSPRKAIRPLTDPDSYLSRPEDCGREQDLPFPVLQLESCGWLIMRVLVLGLLLLCFRIGVLPGT